MSFSEASKTANGGVEEYELGDNHVDAMRSSAMGGTQSDAQDMYRMGKKQELRVS
jgi:hypothetical protein